MNKSVLNNITPGTLPGAQAKRNLRFGNTFPGAQVSMLSQGASHLADTVSFSGVKAKAVKPTSEVQFGAGAKDADQGKTIANQKALLEAAKKQLAADYVVLQKKRQSAQKANSWIKGISAAAGLLAGLVIDVSSMGASGGLGSGAGTVIGTYVGKWIGDSVEGGSVKEIQVKVYARQIATDSLEQSIEQAEAQLKFMKDWVKKAKANNSTEGIEWPTIKQIVVSDFTDIQNYFKKPFLFELNKTPGFFQKYENLIGSQKELIEQIQTLKLMLGSNEPKIQAKALSDYYKLDYSFNLHYGESKPVYLQFLQSNFIVTQVAVLKAYMQEPQLRPLEDDYKAILENLLSNTWQKCNVSVDSPENESGLQVILDAIKSSDLRSPTMNYYLEQIATTPNPDLLILAQQAKTVLADRHTKGLYRQLVAKDVAAEVSQKLVGNPKLQKQLENALMIYKGTVNEPSKNTAAMKLLMIGEPGIGKTLLAKQLHQAIHQSDQGYVRIVMSSVKSYQDFVARLMEASPLQGKTIFLDEFQALDNIPVKERNGLIELLKVMTSTDEAEAQTLEEFGISLKGSILIVASNDQLKDIKSLKGKPSAKALGDRLSCFSQINLNADFTLDDLDAFLDRYAVDRLYTKEYASLGEKLTLSDSAKAAIKKSITENDNGTTLSARQIVAKISLLVQAAVYGYEEHQETRFIRNGRGVISEAVLIDTDESGEVVATRSENGQSIDG